MNWLNEPPQWAGDATALTLTTGPETDFWRKTHYGFIHDNGHFLDEEVKGDFTAEVIFGADYQALYDQAGLMLRISPDTWIKTGVEFAHGHCMLSAVVTRDVSDWSISSEVGVKDELRLRMTRKGDAVCIQWAPASGGPFGTLRLCAFPEGGARVGPMACSPTRAGLVARFRDFRIGPAIDFAASV
ncbi:MAG: DUF1349 domain-containing protein [Rhizobiales bacterium]|nr:DUF1349 domain-containing protein [Hyphomicrobiales bacterium]